MDKKLETTFRKALKAVKKSRSALGIKGSLVATAGGANAHPKPYGYILATDSFLSGWGKAPGRSLYAIAVNSPEEADVVEANMKSRSEMKRVRFSSKLPRVGPTDHLSVRDRKQAGRFFLPPTEGGFATRDDEGYSSHPPKFRTGDRVVESTWGKGTVTFAAPFNPSKGGVRQYKVMFDKGTTADGRAYYCDEPNLRKTR